MINTVKERLEQLRKNHNRVNVLAETAGNTLTLTGVTVKKVAKDYAVFFNASTTTNTAIPYKRLKDVIY